MNIEQKKIQKRISLVIFFLLFISYSHFLQDTNNWNPVTRVALGISMIEDGSLNINKFRPITKDMAYYEKNYYSDKAPGMTFSALPAIALSILYLDSKVQDYKWITNQRKVTNYFVFVMQIATIFTSALLTALAAVALYLVAIRLGAGVEGAVFGALAFGLATPAWGWATVFFGHVSAGSYLFLGLVIIIYLLKSHRSKGIEIAAGFCAGALLTWAVVIEYTSAPASAIIAIYGLACAWKWERARFLKVLCAAVSGYVIFILPLLIYNYMVYDDLFTSGYRFHSTFAETKVGFYGIKSPKLPVIVRLLFGMKRGIIWLSPLLLFVPYAIYRQWKIPGQRGLVITIILIAMYYFLWNSGYIYWTGGSTTGPRFLTPVLPFLCLPLAILWAKAGNYLKVCFSSS